MWSLVPSPNEGEGSSDLSAVAALSSTDVWAAGYYTVTNGMNRTLFEHWDGSSWSTVPGSVDGSLYGLSAVSPADIWAVGYVGLFPGPYQTLVQHWDGSAWSVVPSPNPGFGGQLLGVDALSTNDVWAVGYYYTGASSTQTLVEHWDGTQWSVIPSADIAPSDELAVVFALSPDNIWAVGGYVSNRQYYTMIQHWDGVQWTALASPNLPGYLLSLSGTSPTDVWAVGYFNNNGLSETLIEHWDGSQWTRTSSPNPGSTFNSLQSVVALSLTNAWAVGSGAGTLALHWDGTAWSQVSTPNVQGGGSLSAVAAVSSQDAWAVGDYYDTNTFLYKTLAAHYASPCAPTATVTPTSSATETSTRTSTAPPTSTATSTATSTTQITFTATPSRTPCSLAFSDVHSTDYFYEAASYLYCQGAISGYSDGMFRPYNNTTRGQLSKIVVLAEGLAIDTGGGQHFIDVQPGSTFYAYVETAYNNNLISGYLDGSFRPGNNVTRAQLCKIIVNAQRWTIDTIGGPHFSDVPVPDPFYAYVETAYNHSIVSGYSDGTFRPGSNATRGQICKIVYNAIH